MSLLNSVTALKTFSNTSSLGNTCSTQKAVEGSSIFTQNKISKNDDNKKNLSEEEIMQKATSYSQNFIKKYDCSKLRSKVENIEKSMRFSKNAELCSVPTNLKSSIKKIQEKDNQDDKITKASFEEALKNDEISNVITSLIKYADGKEKDKVLDNYLKKDESQNNTANTQNQTTFNADFFKNKKNPFLQ